MLDVRHRDPELVVDQLVGVFHRLYAAYWGPRTEDVLRSACLTLTRRPDFTLADVPHLLSNPRYRATLTADLLGSAQSTFSLARIVDGGILLARLPKGVLGDDTSRLVGSLLLAGSGKPPPPGPPPPNRGGSTTPSMSTNARISCTCRGRSTMCSPRPARLDPGIERRQWGAALS